MVYLIAFHLMAFVYPVAGLHPRVFLGFGIARPGDFLGHCVEGIFLLCSVEQCSFSYWRSVSACWFKSMKKAVGITAGTVFALSLYLGYGMMLGLPVAFLPIYQIRVVVSTPQLWQPESILVGVVWAGVFWMMAWKIFKKSDFR